MFELLELLKRQQLHQASAFLREVHLSSSPSAVLATNQQLDNIVTFCCQEFCTRNRCNFNLGDFYVTLTTYRNFTLENPHTKHPPAFIGPAFLHIERREQDYHTSLLRLQQKLKVYGTDGEQLALLNAVQNCRLGYDVLFTYLTTFWIN